MKGRLCKYAKLAGPATRACASFLARGGRFVQLEGKERRATSWPVCVGQDAVDCL